MKSWFIMLYIVRRIWTNDLDTRCYFEEWEGEVNVYVRNVGGFEFFASVFGGDEGFEVESSIRNSFKWANIFETLLYLLYLLLR